MYGPTRNSDTREYQRRINLKIAKLFKNQVLIIVTEGKNIRMDWIYVVNIAKNRVFNKVILNQPDKMRLHHVGYIE